MTDATATTRHRRTGILAALGVLVADQAIKWLVTGPLGLVQDGQQYQLLPIFDLTRASNEGISFGFLQADSHVARWLLVALTAAVAGGVAWWMWREKRRGDVIALALVLGGAVGNIIDRVRLGYVIDYADLHFGEFRPFLIFNVADAAITIGVLLLVARALLLRDKDSQQR